MPSAAELLGIWERGLAQKPVDRALSLLSVASPGLAVDSLAQFSIGERDAELLLLRKRLFGPRLINTAVCPQCAQRVEWETDIGALSPSCTEQSNAPKDFDLEVDEYTIRFRLPNSIDISTVADSGGPEAEQKLLTRCVLSAYCKDQPLGVELLPDQVRQTLSRRMEELDPQADMRMSLTCPNCNHQWECLFDIASYLWNEIDSWAERILLAVHKLAKAYGWSEQHILGMSPVRRQLYLGMVS